RLPGFHLRAVEGPDADFLEAALAAGTAARLLAEHVGRKVDAVRPDGALRIVGEPRVRGVVRADGIQPIAAEWIAGLRDRAEVGRAGGLVAPGEIHEDETVSERVVQHHGVTVVARIARRPGSGACPEGVEGEGSLLGSRLAEDADRRIDRLHVIVGPDVTVG